MQHLANAEHEITIAATVLRCQCGHPGWHRGEVCPMASAEPRGIIAHSDLGLRERMRRLAARAWDRLSQLCLATVVTNVGVAIESKSMLQTATEPKYIGVGTGNGTSAVTDTTLFSEVNAAGSSSGSRVTGTGAQATTTVTNDTFQVTGTFTSTDASTLGITNAGLWDNATIGSGNLYCKGDFSVVNLNDGDSIAFTFNVKFVAG